MQKSFVASLLLILMTLAANAAELPSTGEDLDKISEFNRSYWRWRRCVAKYEEVHGSSKDGKPPPLCGEEPQPPK